MKEEDYIKAYGVTKDKWLIYNRKKQIEYRTKKRGRPPHHSTTFVKYTRIEEILTSEGHCGFCQMLLSSDYHNNHPLVGCRRHIEKYRKSL